MNEKIPKILGFFALSLIKKRTKKSNKKVNLKALKRKLCLLRHYYFDVSIHKLKKEKALDDLLIK